jgi:transcriptional antiterminator RfaH
MIDTVHVTSPLESRWYAVQARPRQEERAAMNLVSSGITTFLPMIRQGRRASSASASGIAPLFPRYLFVRCDLASSAHNIRYTRGVAKMLGTIDGPTPIDDAIIESIQERIGEDGFVRLTDALETGDPIEITSGPLRGLVGIFQSATSAAKRVVLLLNAMNSQMRVLVDSTVVRRLTT